MTELRILEQREQVQALLKRVPFTSLPFMIGLALGCVLVFAGSFVPYLLSDPPQDQPKLFHLTVLLNVATLAAFGGFFVYGLFPRRARYKKQFEEMLTREPLLRWAYTDEEWSAWKDYLREFGYVTQFPRKLIKGGILFGVIGGIFYGMMGTRNYPFLGRFTIGFCFVFGLATMVAILYLFYWMHLWRDWERETSEAVVFSDGIYFHHKFFDWKDAPNKMVWVKIATEGQPISTLDVQVEGESNGLAPQIPTLFFPIPHDQMEKAQELTTTLTQNVKPDEEEDQEQK